MANPGGEVELSPGQLLVVLGSKSQLSKLRGLLGDALDTVESMAG